MSVNKTKRKESKVEFDATYFKLFNDATFLIENHFGAKNETMITQIIGDRILRVVFDIGTHIRMANSIYPTCEIEYQERRLHQDKAIGLCFDLLTKYQLILEKLKIPDDKYVNEIKNVIHEINCLKRWRETDHKRFKFAG